MRHAKSSWDNTNLADFDRPLNTRGLHDAPFMGSIIYENGFAPEMVFSSPAKRAKQTAVLVKETAGIQSPVKYLDQIYEASPSSLLRVVSEFPEYIDSALLIGHNPGIEGFIKLLTNELHPIPTATFIRINLSVSHWEEITANCGRIEVIMRPKELAQRVEI